MEKLLATVEVLSIKIESNHLQRVIMSWIYGGGQLPRTCKEYTEIMKVYQNKTMMRILSERDHLNEVFFSHTRFQESQPKTTTAQREAEATEKMREDRSLILDNASSRSPKFAYFNRINLMRAETNIIRMLIDCRLIKIATQMIETEHSALHAAFE